MTVVNPKSISGINSITTGSGSDDVLTIHNNNGTERLRVQSDKVMFSVDAKVDGDSTRDLGASGAKWKDAYVTTLIASSSAKVGSGVTLSSDGDIFATGVCTATSFSGDGSNLTGISAGVSLSNGSNNRIVTATGAAAITGESELTYDSGTLNLVPSSGEGRILVIGGEGEDARISLTADDGDDHIDQYNIESRASDNSFRIDQFSGGSRVDRLSIDTEASGGNVTIHTGNLVIGTSGKGIDFSATGDGGGSSSNVSEVLDDYEEGNFVPYMAYSPTSNDPAYSFQSGFYVKIGKLVTFQARINLTSAGTGSANLKITNFPFAPTPSSGGLSNPMVTIKPVVGVDVGGDREIFAQFEGGNSSLVLYTFGIESSSDYASFTQSNIDNDAQVAIFGHYYTDS